ncbi:MAG: helix-turn-helix domain-containing protein [Nitrospirae bacterium]|nr:MAG: helix-turn-helix domain-containing protein [Nitrospirota bacterium]
MNDAIKIKLGGRIRQLRKLRGYTQEKLDEKSGISYKFIGEIERGEVNPSLDSLASIASALNVEIRELFPDETDFISQFTHDDLQAIKKAARLLNSKLNLKSSGRAVSTLPAKTK